MSEEEVEKELFLRFTDYSDNVQEEFGSGYYFAKIDGKIVFYLEIGQASKEGIRSLSYATLSEYRKRGYASRILGEVMNVLFQNLEVQEIHLTVSPSNVASTLLVHKLGFMRHEENEFTYLLRNPFMDEEKKDGFRK